MNSGFWWFWAQEVAEEWCKSNGLCHLAPCTLLKLYRNGSWSAAVKQRAQNDNGSRVVHLNNLNISHKFIFRLVGNQHLTSIFYNDICIIKNIITIHLRKSLAPWHQHLSSLIFHRTRASKEVFEKASGALPARRRSGTLKVLSTGILFISMSVCKYALYVYLYIYIYICIYIYVYIHTWAIYKYVWIHSTVYCTTN